MRLEPAELSYKATGGLQCVQLYNTTDKRKAVKVSLTIKFETELRTSLSKIFSNHRGPHN